MGDKTGISWTHTHHPDGTITEGATWNPLVGCQKVSEGCRHCYADQLHTQRHKAFLEGKDVRAAQYARPFTEIQLMPERLDQPLRWKRPRKIFVNSVSDLFHKDVPDRFIDQVFGVMIVASEADNLGHTFQVLTKRPERMAEYFADPSRPSQIARHLIDMQNKDMWYDWISGRTLEDLLGEKIWLGTSIEDQHSANSRIPHLLKVPAKVRFLSAEPLLGEVDLIGDPDEKNGPIWLRGKVYETHTPAGHDIETEMDCGIHWVIVGGESGREARPMHPDWARGLRDQCEKLGVPFFFKQWGEYIQKEQAPISKDELARFTHTGEWGCMGLNGRFWPETSPFSEEVRMVRLGKHKTGDLLDGVKHQAFPEVGL